MRFVAHATETAATAATEDLEAAAQTFRFVPNLLGGLAEVPIAPRARVVDAMSGPVPFPVRRSEIWGHRCRRRSRRACASLVGSSAWALRVERGHWGGSEQGPHCSRGFLTQRTLTPPCSSPHPTRYARAWRRARALRRVRRRAARRWRRRRPTGCGRETLIQSPRAVRLRRRYALRWSLWPPNGSRSVPLAGDG